MRVMPFPAWQTSSASEHRLRPRVAADFDENAVTAEGVNGLLLRVAPLELDRDVGPPGDRCVEPATASDV